MEYLTLDEQVRQEAEQKGIKEGKKEGILENAKRVFSELTKRGFSKKEAYEIAYGKPEESK